MRKVRFNLIPPVVALALLSVLAVETLSRPKLGDAEPYHAHVRQAAAAIPPRLGDWVGKDRPKSEDAERLLKPNVIYERNFYNSVSNQSVSVLIVHCKDARNLEGHYPPVCYPNSGMHEEAKKERHWKFAGLDMPGMEYTFRSRRGLGEKLTVYNFLILPPKYDKDLTKVEDGTYVPDMQGVNRNAWDYLRRYFGAAQVQVLFADNTLLPEQREAIFTEMITAHKDLIEAIRSGAKP